MCALTLRVLCCQKNDQKKAAVMRAEIGSTSDDEDGGNPMVASFQDEVELDQVPVISSFAGSHSSPRFSDQQQAGPAVSSLEFRTETVDESPTADFCSEHPASPSTEVQQQSLFDDTRSLPRGNESENEQDEEADVQTVVVEPVQTPTISASDFSSWLEQVETKIEAASIQKKEFVEPEKITPKVKKVKSKDKSKKPKKAMAVEEPGIAEIPRQKKSSQAVLTSPTKRSSQKSEQEMLERELEDFLASD